MTFAESSTNITNTIRIIQSIFQWNLLVIIIKLIIIVRETYETYVLISHTFICVIALFSAALFSMLEMYHAFSFIFNGILIPSGLHSSNAVSKALVGKKRKKKELSTCQKTKMIQYKS